MSTSSTSTRDEVIQLRTELEYSAFLNKGVLQTNAEHKVRIAELESENQSLRRSEKQLSRVEDELEDAQKALKEWESAAMTWERDRQKLKEALKVAKQAAEVLEAEKLDWINRFANLSEAFAAFIDNIDKARQEAASIQAGSSRRQTVVRAASVKAGRVQSPRSPSAPAAVSSSATRRVKRLRLTSSAEDDREPSPVKRPNLRPQEVIASPRMTTRQNDATPRRKAQDAQMEKHSSGSRAKPTANPNPSSRLNTRSHGETSSSRVRTERSYRNIDDIEIKIKDEPGSPGLDDSEDDPLAMSEFDE